MVEIEQIPIELRWRLAARTLAVLPLAYNQALREKMGEEYDKIEQQVLGKVAKDSRALAAAFQIPIHGPRSLAEIIGVTNAILFGPGFAIESEESPEGVVLRMTSCPMIGIANEIGLEPGRAYPACTAFHASLIESLNPEFRLIQKKAICKGDAYCEMVIEQKDRQNSNDRTVGP
jgi:predicted ArsR family transcriptional regulator